ncbi:MAG: DUF3024 domain-containing protein [Bacteroidetes bacterium]|nr:MAG: DUF3024 domain-containing protein [Bacteroidota bacterium]
MQQPWPSRKEGVCQNFTFIASPLPLSSLNWHSYPATPSVKSVKEFCKLVEEDEHYCFFG